jgi:S1-C subfamily serine protease
MPAPRLLPWLFRTPIGIATLSFLAAGIVFSCSLWIRGAPPERTGVQTVLPGVTMGQDMWSDPGLIVTSVRLDSQAKRQGIAVGDDILTINGLAAQPGRQRSYYEKAGGQHSMTFTLRHGDTLRTVTLDLNRDKLNGP